MGEISSGYYKFSDLINVLNPASKLFSPGDLVVFQINNLSTKAFGMIISCPSDHCVYDPDITILWSYSRVF